MEKETPKPKKKSGILKKILIGSGIFFAVLILTLVLIPVFFKDEIIAKVNKTAGEYIEAEVSFKELDLSLIRHFPKASFLLTDLEVKNKGKFEGDTLLRCEEIDVSVDIMSLFGNDMQVHAVALNKPEIRVKVLEDGSANYDIYKGTSSEEQSAAAQAEDPLKINMESWEIKEAYLLYNDESTKTFAEIVGLNHSGSGALADDIFDLETLTEITETTVISEGTAYLRKKAVKANINLNMDMKNSKYTFLENSVKVQDFEFGFDGFFKIPEQGYEMDIRFDAKESTFKSLLSLIPESFLKGYEDLKAEGEFSFNGFVKGIYDEGRLPAFNVKLNVNNGMVQYPDLPKAVSNIHIDMEADNKDGVLDNTLVNIRDFSMKLGDNPVKGKVKVKGLEKYDIDADIHAKVNLVEVAEMYPLESVKELRGLFVLDLTAKGVYDSEAHRIPNIDADMSLTDGFVLSADYPVPMEKIHVQANAKNTSGTMADTHIDLKDISLQVDGEPFEIHGNVHNLDDYTYDLLIKGALDLEKVTKIYPIEGMDLKGRLTADIQTEGKMSDIDAERYEALPTKGNMTLSAFEYKSPDLPQGMRITSSEITFSPEKMNLTTFEGFLGESDVSMDGYLLNYLAYGLKMAGMKSGEAKLVGKLNHSSKKFNTNEWMTEEEINTDPQAEEETYSVIEIPRDIDFTFNSNIREVLYEDMKLTNLNGIIKMQGGRLSMQNVTFNTAGGKILMSGSYDTSKDSKQPDVDMDFNILNMKVQEAFNTFNTIQTLAPVAKHINGDFTTQFKVKGKLGEDLMPKYETLTGNGLINLKDAVFSGENPPIVNNLSSFMSVPNLKNSKLNDLLMKGKIENGKLKVEPFDMEFAGYKAVVSGTSGIDGSIDYTVNFPDFPIQEVDKMIKAKTGLSVQGLGIENLKLGFRMTGDYANPKVELANQAEIKKQITAALKKKAKDEAGNFLNDLIGGGDDKSDSTKTGEEETTGDKAKDKAKDALNDLNPFGKKKK